MCFASWAVSSFLHTFFFASFWHRLILISAIQRMLFQKWSGFFRCFFFAKSNLALFAPCGEASLFALVKSSLDCRLWQWHVCLLESVLHLAGCCERVFLYHGEDSPIIHHCCPLWMSKSFYVAELTSAFFFFSEYTKLLIWPFLMILLSLWWICFVCFWSLTIVCLTCMESSFPHDVGSQQQLPNTNGTLRIKYTVYGPNCKCTVTE